MNNDTIINILSPAKEGHRGHTNCLQLRQVLQSLAGCKAYHLKKKAKRNEATKKGERGREEETGLTLIRWGEAVLRIIAKSQWRGEERRRSTFEEPNPRDGSESGVHYSQIAPVARQIASDLLTEEQFAIMKMAEGIAVTHTSWFERAV